MSKVSLRWAKYAVGCAVVANVFLPSAAQANWADEWKTTGKYRPVPTIFVHGIKDTQHVWDRTVSKLRKYFDPYMPMGPGNVGPDNRIEGQYAELIHYGTPGKTNGEGTTEEIQYLAWESSREGKAENKTSLNAFINGVLAHYYPNGQDSLATSRVNLICHSMGGLLARYYIMMCQRNGQPHHIGKLITLATPHTGSGWATVACLSFPPSLLQKAGFDRRDDERVREDKVRRILREIGFTNWKHYFEAFPALAQMRVGSPFFTAPQNGINRLDEAPGPSAPDIDYNLFHATEDAFVSFRSAWGKRIGLLSSPSVIPEGALTGEIYLDDAFEENFQRTVGDKLYFTRRGISEGAYHTAYKGKPITDDDALMLKALDYSRPKAIFGKANIYRGEFDANLYQSDYFVWPGTRNAQVEGILLDEYFPVNMKIEVFVKRRATKDPWVRVDETQFVVKPSPEAMRLGWGWVDDRQYSDIKPSALFSLNWTLPTDDQYVVKLRFINATGIISQYYLREPAEIALTLNAGQRKVQCVDMEASLKKGSPVVLNEIILRDKFGHVFDAQPVAMTGYWENAADGSWYKSGGFLVSFADNTIRRFNTYGEPIVLPDGQEFWSLPFSVNAMALGDNVAGEHILVASTAANALYAIDQSGHSKLLFAFHGRVYHPTGIANIREISSARQMVAGLLYTCSNDAKRIDLVRVRYFPSSKVATVCDYFSTVHLKEGPKGLAWPHWSQTRGGYGEKFLMVLTAAGNIVRVKIPSWAGSLDTSWSKFTMHRGSEPELELKTRKDSQGIEHSYYLVKRAASWGQISSGEAYSLFGFGYNVLSHSRIKRPQQLDVVGNPYSYYGDRTFVHDYSRSEVEKNSQGAVLEDMTLLCRSTLFRGPESCDVVVENISQFTRAFGSMLVPQLWGASGSVVDVISGSELRTPGHAISIDLAQYPYNDPLVLRFRLAADDSSPGSENVAQLDWVFSSLWKTGTIRMRDAVPSSLALGNFVQCRLSPERAEHFAPSVPNVVGSAGIGPFDYRSTNSKVASFEGDDVLIHNDKGYFRVQYEDAVGNGYLSDSVIAKPK